MKLPKLTPRLQKIYDILTPCETVCDIGTDHAYIPVCLCLNNKCKKAIASDIKKGPVERAKKTVSLYGAQTQVEVRLGGGLETVSVCEADAIIIAGMGGLLIAQILEESENIAKSAKELILQPMTAIAELREFLNKNGYTINEEHIVREEEKLYTIMKVSVGKDIPYTEAELYLGKAVIKNEHYEAYKISRLNKIDKQIAGLERSQNTQHRSRLNNLLSLKEMIENENQ
ncbi:MAG: SAM-dependent methyltransferase [Clostridia bacterium]|nr:SAM-dependent methyltransferase [Clostridia bacterium]